MVFPSAALLDEWGAAADTIPPYFEESTLQAKFYALAGVFGSLGAVLGAAFTWLPTATGEL